MIELAISHDVTLTRLRMTFDIIYHVSFYLTSCLLDSFPLYLLHLTLLFFLPQIIYC